ncbi:MAG: hypothetical protein ACP5D2_03460 [Candidatus Nanoarchaeia archaeon]
MIKKTSRGYEVKAKTGRTMGIYKTKAEAESRLKQIEMFKAMAKERMKKMAKARKKK